MASQLVNGNRGKALGAIGSKFLLKNKGACPSLSQGTECVVPDMRRPARIRRRCRRCPFCAPSGRCLDRTLKSGRCGDWVWYMRGRKRCRRRYTRPRDPGTLTQRRSRSLLSFTAKKYSHYLTDEQHDACIVAGARIRSRPRLGQSGPLTGQQYLVHKEYAQPKAKSKATKMKSAPQVPQPPKVTQSTWDPRRGASRVAPDRRRLGTGHASGVRRGKSLMSSFPALPAVARAPRFRGIGRGPLRTPPPNRYAPPGPPCICWTRQARLSSAGIT